MSADVTLIIRRATETDGAAVRSLIGRAPALGEEHVTFVLTEDDGVIGALDVAKDGRDLRLEAIAVAPSHRRRGHGRRLVDFAEAAARQMTLREVRLGAGVTSSPFFEALGFRDGRKRLAALGYLDGMGVPLLRDGDGPLARTAHYRGVWVALVIVVGVGGVPFVVAGAPKPSLFVVVVLTLLCLAAAGFALWQLWLIVLAARRHGSSRHSTLVVGCTILSAVALLYVVVGEALPQLIELGARHSSGALS